MNTLTRWILWITPLALAAPASPQIAQNHPELCGGASQAVPIPKGVSASLQDTQIALTLLADGAPRPVRFPEVGVEEIRQVCPVGPDSLVVFGWNGAYEVMIVGLDDGTIRDSFIAYDTVMSPDQHWLAMRRFYAFHTEFVPSEEYALYDLRASAAANRRGPRASMDFFDTPGWAIYPALANKFQVEAGDVPDADIHQFRSNSFYWDPTSQYVVFADSQHGTLSVVLSQIQDGKITTRVHPVAASDLCSAASDWRLSQATVTPINSSTPMIVAEFQSDEAPCAAKPLTLTLADFTPAETESYGQSEGRPPYRADGPPLAEKPR